MLALQQPREATDELPLPSIRKAVQQFSFFDAVTPADVEPSLRQHLRTVILWARLRQPLGIDYIDEMWHLASNGTHSARGEAREAFYLLTCETFAHKLIGPLAGPYGALSVSLTEGTEDPAAESAPPDGVDIDFSK
jgi:hypothetical protein